MPTFLKTLKGSVKNELTTVIAFVICGLLLTALVAMATPIQSAAFEF